MSDTPKPPHQPNPKTLKEEPATRNENAGNNTEKEEPRGSGENSGMLGEGSYTS